MDSLGDDTRWAVLDRNSNKAPIPARSELHRSAILDEGLTLDPNWAPEYHVDVVEWPEEESEQTSVAQALYAAQNCIVRPA